jgi:GntR family transcriptional regulator
MFQIDLKSHKPIYEQIVDNYKRLITSGAMNPDDRVPSVRDMAKALAVNPNTIQKAYRELEQQGYFYTTPGQGNFVSPAQKRDNTQEIRELYVKLENTARDLLFFGETPDAVCAFINSILKK